MKKIILASASPRRAEILTRSKIPFEVRISPADEPEIKPRTIPTPLWPMCLAYMKATAVQKVLPKSPRIILAADTIVVEGSRILNKARDRAHAKRILQSLNHKPHQVITGICLMSAANPAHFRLASASATCKLHFTPRQLEEYLDSNLWKGKAGAYGIQDTPNGDPFTTLISGEITTVIGLPISLVQSELASFQKE